jgi:two-component system OmpR family response regulator
MSKTSSDKRSRRILVIDDNEAVLNSIVTVLSGAGYDVIATQQTVGAARHLKGCELVIIDYHMPGLHGGDVVRSLRAAAVTLQVSPAFYLYTSDALVEQKPKALGFDGVFTRKGQGAWLAHQVEAAFRLVDLAARARGGAQKERDKQTEPTSQTSQTSEEARRPSGASEVKRSDGGESSKERK